MKSIEYLKSSIFNLQSSFFNFQSLDRVQTGETQAVGFFKAAHDVHGVDGLSGGPFHQVVDGGNHHQPGAGKFESDVAIIRADKDFGLRETINTLLFFHNSDEGFLTVDPTVGLPDILFSGALRDE